MMGAPEGTPAHWLAYFLVPDADAAAASANAAGGTILAEPFDTPYGRMAGIIDPHGPLSSSWGRWHRRDHELAGGPGGIG